jgi:hypothetical protein
VPKWRGLSVLTTVWQNRVEAELQQHQKLMANLDKLLDDAWRTLLHAEDDAPQEEAPGALEGSLFLTHLADDEPQSGRLWKHPTARSATVG